MKTVTLDFESFWSTDYSLSKMDFIHYINDPRWETISVSLKEGDGATKVYLGEDDVAAALKAIDWSEVAAIAHNGAEFDFPVLVWKYDCHPKLFVDTLHLARAKHQSDVGGSLAKLSVQYGLPVKDSTILHNTKGKRYADFEMREILDMIKYNGQDTDNCYSLFKIFAQADVLDDDDLRRVMQSTLWHKRELLFSDMTTRMICYPQLRCDEQLLSDTLVQAEANKEKLLQDVAETMGLLDTEEVRAELASNAKFANVLQTMGVDPPMKVSKTTGKQTYAFAKSDDAFTALLEHPNEHVQNLVASRLGVKSTLLETRLERMRSCAEKMGGWMPVPLAYHAATTGRWGGRVWNPQNLPRMSEGKLTNALRMALMAPPGHKVVVSDLSGIELRVNHYLWGVESTKALYAKDPQADLYRTFAAKMYGIAEEAVTKVQRQLAKVAQLGLGFGAGAVTFQSVAKAMGGITLDLPAAEDVVRTWRQEYRAIELGWSKCFGLVRAMAGNALYPAGVNDAVMAINGRIRLPSGRFLYYPDLRSKVVDSRTMWVYGHGKNQSAIYGGRMCENLVQAIARDVIAEQALVIYNRTGYRPALTVHDELVYVVPEDKAESHLAVVNEVMRTPPSWLPGIVLWSEGDIADRYGLAK